MTKILNSIWNKTQLNQPMCLFNSPCPLFFTLRNLYAPYVCPSLLFLPWKKRGVPLLWSPKRKKKGKGGIQELDAPNSTCLPPPLLPILMWFCEDLLASFWASKRGSSTSYTVENWRRKFFPRRDRSRKKMDLLSCMQPWRRSSSSIFFFIFF